MGWLMTIQVSGVRTDIEDNHPFRILKVPPSIDKDSFITAIVDEICQAPNAPTDALAHYRPRIVIYSKQPGFFGQENVWEVFAPGTILDVNRGKRYPAHYFELSGDIRYIPRLDRYSVSFYHGDSQPMNDWDRAREFEKKINRGELFKLII